MNEKEKFEDIIASKFSEAEFPFDEANWDAAEEMIDAKRVKEKRRKIGFIFFSGILLGVLMMLPFVIKYNEITKNEIAETIEPSAKETAGVEAQKEVLAEKTVEKLTGNPANKNTTPGNITNTIQESENKANESISNSAGTEVAKAEPIKTQPKVYIPKRKPYGSIVTTNPSHTDETGNAISHSSVNHPVNNNLHVNTLAMNSPGVSFLPKLENDVEIAKDSIPDFTVLGTPEKLPNMGKEYHPWNVSASIGGNYVNHFSLNPIQGLEISRAITPHFEVGTGAYYTYLTVGSGAVKSITTSSDYDFGYKRDVTEIKTNKLHYAVIPVYAKYNLNENNSFIAGANLYALFTSSNSVTSYKEVYGEKQSVATKKSSGYSSGINLYDIGLLAGYKRHLFGNLGAAIYFNYGLKDIKKNAYYNENKFERNVSGQIMLTYKL